MKTQPKKPAAGAKRGGQDPDLSGGVPVSDREAFPGGAIQHRFVGRAVLVRLPFDSALGESLPAEGIRGVEAQAARATLALNWALCFLRFLLISVILHSGSESELSTLSQF
jgi:hypothetical protein